MELSHCYSQCNEKGSESGKHEKKEEKLFVSPEHLSSRGMRGQRGTTDISLSALRSQELLSGQDFSDDSDSKVCKSPRRQKLSNGFGIHVAM